MCFSEAVSSTRQGFFFFFFALCVCVRGRGGFTNRCLWKDLSLSSGLRKGSTVVLCHLSHPVSLTLGGRYSPRSPQCGRVVHRRGPWHNKFLLCPPLVSRCLLHFWFYYFSLTLCIRTAVNWHGHRVASVCPAKGHVCLRAVQAWRLRSD